MTHEEKLETLAHKAHELSCAEENLRRYEAEVQRHQGRINHDIHGALKHEVHDAQCALMTLRSSLEGERLAELSPDDIQRIRTKAQEEAIAEVARAQGWQWEEAEQRWRTPGGAHYSRIGEQS